MNILCKASRGGCSGSFSCREFTACICWQVHGQLLAARALLAAAAAASAAGGEDLLAASGSDIRCAQARSMDRSSHFIGSTHRPWWCRHERPLCS